MSDVAIDHTGGDWMRGKSSHTGDDACLLCGEDCSRVALVELVYTFEVCGCDKWPYAHLVERLIHRDHVEMRADNEYSVKLDQDSE